MRQQRGSPAGPLGWRWWWRVNALLLVLLLSWGPPALQALHCPPHCHCRDHATMDCSHSRLSALPRVGRPQSSPLVRVNLSSNSLTSLDDLLQRLPLAQRALDLSFNRISSVPPHTFSGEQFLELRTLNLSGNLLSQAHFVLPSSLEVLRLGGNVLRRFCFSRLKGLEQLRFLHLEHNDLDTLACEDEEEEEESPPPPLPSPSPSPSPSESTQKKKKKKKKKKKGSPPGVCPIEPLLRIKEVWLGGNRLKSVDPGVLDCFRNAHSLSLADNAIEALLPGLFEDFHHLRYLDLSGNRLTFVAEGMFLQMPALRFLSLAQNRLTRVPAALPMLEWLDLSHNAIVSIPESQKAELYPQEVFLVGGNPLRCVCELLWLKELYDTREYLLKFTDVERKKFVPVCASPGHVRGDSWDVLGDQAFGCKGNQETRKKSPTAGSRDGAGRRGEKHTTVVQLEDLAVKVQDVGTTHIRLHWDSLHPLGDESKPTERREARKVFISCHPFGRKQDRKTALVQLALGSHRLRGLEPSTAYVVCLSLADPSSGGAPQPGGGGEAVSLSDCMEVVTKKDEQAELRDVYMRIGVVIVVSILLAIKCCYTNSQRKDVSARLKEE